MDKLYLVDINLLFIEFKKVCRHQLQVFKSLVKLFFLAGKLIDLLLGFIWKKPCLWKDISPEKRVSFDPFEPRSQEMPPRFFGRSE